FFYQLACFYRSAIFKSLAVHYRINSLRLLLHFFYFFELCKRNDARFVRHVILTMFHYFYTDRRTLVGNSGTYYKLNRIVVQYLILIRHLFCFGESFSKSRRKVWFLCVERNKFTTSSLHSFHLRIDMSVIYSDNRKPDTWLVVHFKPLIT